MNKPFDLEAFKNGQKALTPIATKAPKPVQWEPKRVDIAKRYYIIDVDGSVGITTESNDNHDKQRASFGNYFHTEQEAEEAAKQVQQLLRLRAYVREFAPDWKANWGDRLEDKYYVCFDDTDKVWDAYSNQFMHNITTVYMPKQVAEGLVLKLNSGEVVL